MYIFPFAKYLNTDWPCINELKVVLMLKYFFLKMIHFFLSSTRDCSANRALWQRGIPIQNRQFNLWLSGERLCYTFLRFSAYHLQFEDERARKCYLVIIPIAWIYLEQFSSFYYLNFSLFMANTHASYQACHSWAFKVPIRT